MKAVKLTWYQKYFNDSRGFRKDLQKPFLWYVNDWIKSNLFRLTIYSDAVKKPYSKSVEKKGPRGGRTGNYQTEIIPATKATYGNYRVEFFPHKWLAFGLSFNWWTKHIRSYSIAFNLGKPNWQLKLKVQNNTA